MSSFQVVSPSGRAGELAKLFTGRNETIQLQPGGWTYMTAWDKYKNDYATFEYEEGEVIVMTMPKSGTTWTQEIVWTMKNNPDLTNPAGDMPLNIRTPNLEVDMNVNHVAPSTNFKQIFKEKFPDFDQSHGLYLHIARTSPKPRTIKTHLSFDHINKSALDKAKVVYTIRDPRDVCLSYFHHCRIFMYDNFTGTLDQFVDAFLEDVVLLGPYWSSVGEAWKRRNHPNLHIMFYEKMKKNTAQELSKLNKFLGTNLNDAQIKNVIHQTSFEEMKKRDNHVLTGTDAAEFMDMGMVKKEGGFFKSGSSGGWRKVLSDEQKQKFEAWIKKNCPDEEIMNNIMNP